MSSKDRFILLSFDVEEFDMPLEYNYQISRQEQLSIGKKGMDRIMPVLNNKNIQATLFTTANFADHFRGSCMVYLSSMKSLLIPIIIPISKMNTCCLPNKNWKPLQANLFTG